MSSRFTAAVVQSSPAVFEPKATLANVRGPVFNQDAIVMAEIDLDEIARGKYDFDVVGHYVRPDVFRLHVNDKPAPPVVAD